MGKETLIAGAEVAQGFFAVRCSKESVLRASAIAHCQDFASLARERQPIQLGLSEGSLRSAFEQFNEWSFPNIPEPVLNVDKMIAGKEVSVMFDNGNIPADLPKYTETMVLPEGSSDGLLEYLYVHLPDIMA